MQPNRLCVFSIEWLKNPKLNGRCMEILLAQSSSAFISSGTGGLVLIGLFWYRTEHWVSILWAITYLSIAIMRVTLSRKFSGVSGEQRSSPKWLDAYGICLFLTGLVWGSFLAYLGHYSEGIYSVVLLVTFAALLAGAVSAYSVSLPMFLFFSLPMIIPTLFGISLTEFDEKWILIVIILCWYLFMVSTARRFSNFAMRSLGLEYKNDQLVLSLEEQKTRAEILAEELLVLSNTDGLTGVYNRRYFDERIRHEWHRGQRSKKTVSIVLCDIDYFKKLNDSLGHDAGDKCLIKVAQALAEEVRGGTDFIARIGGEEFAALLAETELDNAVRLAKRLNNIVSSLNIKHPSSPILDKITMCFGVASIAPTSASQPSDLLKIADKKLYLAKEGGRNRIES